MSRQQARLAMVMTCGIAAVAACSPAVRSDRDESIPIPQGATWTWETPGGTRQPYESDSAASARPRAMTGPPYGTGEYDRRIPLDHVIFAQRFRAAAETTMQARGFRKVDDPAQAEFLLAFELRQTRVRYGETLVVMFRQRERGDVAWRASYLMDIYDMRQTSESSVQKVANKVLRGLR